MKKYGNYLLAVLVFAVVMLIFNGWSIVLSLAAALCGALMRGAAGVMDAAHFLMEHLDFFSFLVYFTAFCVFALWYYFASSVKEKSLEQTGRRKLLIDPSGLIWIAALALAVQHLTSIVFGIISVVAPELMEAYTRMMETSGVTEYSVMWCVSTLILPPLTEEIIFRGLITQYVCCGGAPFAVANIIQAVFFGIFHQNIVQGVYAALLGMILGYLARRFGTLAAPMFMHLCFNLFGTVLVDLENAFLPDTVQVVLVIISLPVTVFLLIMIHLHTGERHSKRERQGEEI